MAAQNVKLAGKDFVIVPRKEYAQLKRKAGQAKARGALRPKSKGTRAGLPAVEVYSDRRIAEFLLSNSTDASDYARACEDVRKMGLEPNSIPHHKPPGVK